MKNRKTVKPHPKNNDISRELNAHGGRLDGIEKSMMCIFDKLSDHEIRLVRIEENMATKWDLVAMENRINTTLDKVLEIVSRNDHEMAMLKYRVEEHDDVIRQMKPKLGMA